MNYRHTQIKAKESYAADKTEIIDINVADPISALLIELTVTSSVSAFTAHPLTCLTKIELVDGSEILFSLTGKEADALDWYHNGGKFRSNYNYWLAGTSQNFIGINFGRFLWDSQLAFDPKKFTNPQLKLTLDIDAGGGTATANTLAVSAALFDQKEISPIGFLMAKEIKDYAMGPSAHEYTDLPTDHPYRRLLLRCQKLGTEPGQLINKIKLDEDTGKRIILNEEPDDILRSLANMFPPCVEDFWTSIGTGITRAYISPTTRITAFAERWAGSANAGVMALYNGDGGRLDMYRLTAASNAQVRVAGWLPHGVYDIPLGLLDEIADWYDVSKIGSLVADIDSRSGAAATDSAQIFIQQLRKYAA